jgi:PAS domain S-box-containing protein
MQVESHQFLSAILNTNSLLVIVLDTQGRIYRFNRACEQTTGYTSHEVIGKFFWDCLLLPEDIEPVKAYFEGMQDRTIQERQDLYFLTRDGSRRLIAWTRTPWLNEQGLEEYLIGIGTDITEKQQAEENLRRKVEEPMLRRLFWISPPPQAPDLLEDHVERATTAQRPAQDYTCGFGSRRSTA